MSKDQVALTDELALAQIDHLKRLTPMLAIVSLVNGGLVATVFLPTAPQSLVLVWLALCWGLSFYQIWRHVARRARPLPMPRTDRLRRRAVVRFARTLHLSF